METEAVLEVVVEEEVLLAEVLVVEDEARKDQEVKDDLLRVEVVLETEAIEDGLMTQNRDGRIQNQKILPLLDQDGLDEEIHNK